MNDPAIRQFEDRIAGLERKLETQTTAQSLAQVSKIYPKTNSVVFVGGSSFGNNIKYTYLAFHEWAAGKGIDVCLFARDPAQLALLKDAGLPALSLSDPNYLQILLGAKVAVLDNNFYPGSVGGPIPHALLQGAKFIQLWHGVPLKEIGLQTFSSIDVMASCGPFDALVATNASSRTDWARRFSFHEFAPIGYPRNDVLLREPTKPDLLNVDMDVLTMAQDAQRAGKPVIMYAPTFRDHIGPAWFEKSGIETLAAHCEARGYEFIVNLHPGEQSAIPGLRQRYPSLRFIAPHTDVYPIVKYTDVMLTDYSSLAFDFLLLDRPVVFYRPDHEEYITKARPLIAGREHYTPGPVIAAMSGLIAATDSAVMDRSRPDADKFRAARLALRRELFDHCDGKSGDRVCELIMKYLEAAS